MPDIVGLEQHEPTSLRGLAIGESLETEMNRAAASMTEEPDAGKLHVRVCAHRDLAQPLAMALFGGDCALRRMKFSSLRWLPW